jgi:hypothetical protein
MDSSKLAIDCKNIDSDKLWGAFQLNIDTEIKSLKLETLECVLEENKIKETFLWIINRLGGSVEVLAVNSSNVSDKQLNEVISRLPNLKKLVINDTKIDLSTGTPFGKSKLEENICNLETSNNNRKLDLIQKENHQKVKEMKNSYENKLKYLKDEIKTQGELLGEYEAKISEISMSHNESLKLDSKSKNLKSKDQECNGNPESRDAKSKLKVAEPNGISSKNQNVPFESQENAATNSHKLDDIRLGQKSFVLVEALDPEAIEKKTRQQVTEKYEIPVQTTIKQEPNSPTVLGAKRKAATIVSVEKSKKSKFECEECKASFTHTATLKRHIQVSL